MTEEKKFKELTKEQREVLEHKKEMCEMNILKNRVELNKVNFDLDEQVTLRTLKFEKVAFEKSIEIEKKNIEEINKILEHGFEIKDQHASDIVSEQCDMEKERMKKKGFDISKAEKVKH